MAHISTGDMFRAAMANQTEMGVLASHILTKVSWFRMKLQMELLKNAFLKTTSKKQVSCWMVTHVRLNKLMPWTKHWLNLVSN